MKILSAENTYSFDNSSHKSLRVKLASPVEPTFSILTLLQNTYDAYAKYI